MAALLPEQLEPDRRTGSPRSVPFESYFRKPAAVSARAMTPPTSKLRRGFAGSGRASIVVRGHSVVARSGPCSVTGATAGNGLARSLAAELSTDIAVASDCAL